jgi:uncharacterized DUF497 family protein
MPLVFEWDAKKARTNRRKHGVSFDEACTVFDDPLAAIFADEDHSAGEPREIIIGYSILKRLVLVCFTERPGNRMRVFSARPATRWEQRNHEDYV